MADEPDGVESLEFASDSLFKAALDNQGVGVAVLSLPDFVFEYVNPAFQGFAPGKSMVGHRGDEVFPEMAFLGPPVLAALEQPGYRWREEDSPHRIRRSPNGPLETVYGSFEVSKIFAEGREHLLVTGFETTEHTLMQQDVDRMTRNRLKRLSFAETLDAVNTVIHSSLSYDEIMQRALEEGTKALGAQAGAVFVGVDDHSEARYVFGFPPGFVGRRFSARVFPFSTRLEETKEPVPVGEADMDELMNPALARLLRVRSLLAMPIVTRGELTGGIGLVYRQPHDFDDIELDFARKFSASLSLALENAEFYRRQERVADTLQEALLTIPEHIQGLRIASRYNSAAEAVKVGGDFYDVFQLEHEMVGLTVGDISGKGLEAAVTTSLVKNAIRAQATEKRNRPGDVVRVVNQVMFDASGPETFATVFFGMLDCRSGSLVYCNAGHTTGAIVRATGSIDLLPSNSGIVGGFPRSSYMNAEATIAPGETIFLYTDGLTEARRGAEFYGEERLLRLLGKLADAEPSELVDRAVEDAIRFAGAPLTDDIALLAVRRL